MGKRARSALRTKLPFAAIAEFASFQGLGRKADLHCSRELNLRQSQRLEFSLKKQSETISDCSKPKVELSVSVKSWLKRAGPSLAISTSE